MSVIETVRCVFRPRVSKQRAIELVPERARRVFVLHDVEGFKHHEIAEMMGVPPRAYRKRNSQEESTGS